MEGGKQVKIQRHGKRAKGMLYCKKKKPAFQENKISP